MFGESTLHGLSRLEQAADYGGTVEMENYFSRLALDIIGKAVFNYDFDSLTNDDPIIRVRSARMPAAHWRILMWNRERESDREGERGRERESSFCEYL